MRVVGASPRTIRKRVPYILSLVGLQHKAKHYPTELSGGERQRVGLARALVNNPSMIVADEPTGNIDPALSFEIVDLLSEINRRGTTVLMVTHEHSLVKHFHKRIIQIHSGEIVADTAAMQDSYAPPARQEPGPEPEDDYAEYDNSETYEPEESSMAPPLDNTPAAYDQDDYAGYEPEERTVGEALAVTPEAYDDDDYDEYDDYEDITEGGAVMHSFGYLLSEGLKSLWKNRTMSIASIGVLISCLLMTGIAGLLSLNLSETMASVEGNNVTTVFLKQGLPSLTAVKVGEELKQLDNVGECSFVPKDDALANIIQGMDEEEGVLLYGMQGLENPLPDSYTISMVDLSQYEATIAAIQAVEGVDSITNIQEIVTKLNNLDRLVRY